MRLPTNLNNVKENIRHATPTERRCYEWQLKAYTAYLAIYDGVQGSNEEKEHVANKIFHDIFFRDEFDIPLPFIDRETAQFNKSLLECGLNTTYTGHYSKVIKLVPDLSQINKHCRKMVHERSLSFLLNDDMDVDRYTIYYLNRLNGTLTSHGYFTFKSWLELLKNSVVNSLAVILPSSK